MADDVRPEKVRKTQESLGKFIKKPPLTEKLLKKPPFRFLHDIVTSIMKETGFLQGVFTADELDSDKIKDRDAKIAFLDKLITNIKAATGSTVTAKPSKIVAGLEVNKTLDLLLLLSKAVEVKKTGDKLSQPEKKESKTSTKTPRTKDAKGVEKNKPTKKASDDEKNNQRAARDDKEKSQKIKKTPKEEAGLDVVNDAEPGKTKRNAVAENGRTIEENGPSAAMDEDNREKDDGGADERRKSSRPKDSDGRRKSSRKKTEDAENAAEQAAATNGEVSNKKMDISDQTAEEITKVEDVNGDTHRRKSSSRRSSRSSARLESKNSFTGAGDEISSAGRKHSEDSAELNQLTSPVKAGGDAVESNKATTEELAHDSPVINEQTAATTSGDVAPASDVSKPSTAKIKRPSSARMKTSSSRLRKKLSEDESGGTVMNKLGSSTETSQDASMASGGSGSALLPTLPAAIGGVTTRQASADNDSGIVGTAPSPQPSIPSATGSRRGFSSVGGRRPASARPGAPRPRDRGQVVAAALADQPSQLKPVHLIEDSTSGTGQVSNTNNALNPDDDDQHMVTVEKHSSNSRNTESDQLDSGIEVDGSSNGKDQGALVAQILESKRELEESKIMTTQWAQQQQQGKPSIDIEWEGGRKMRSQAWTAEVEKLKEGIQSVIKASNPLGKLFDFLQEDVELMEREMTMWRETNKQLKSELTNHERDTNESLSVLKKQLEDISAMIENEQEAIRRVKANIVSNNLKIDQLLRVDSP